jgi:hypothetical protein
VVRVMQPLSNTWKAGATGLQVAAKGAKCGARLGRSQKIYNFSRKAVQHATKCAICSCNHSWDLRLTEIFSDQYVSHFKATDASNWESKEV